MAQNYKNSKYHCEECDKIGKQCKNCKYSYNKEYRKNNKEKLLKNKKSYYKENREQILKDRKNYQLNNDEKIKTRKNSLYKENREQILKERKEYYKKNKEKISKREKEYYEKNKINICVKNNEYGKNNKEKRNLRNKNRRKNDLIFRLRNNIRGMVYYVLKQNKNYSSILDYLPYTIEELKQHLESLFEPWMNWENWGVYDPNKMTWQIDHIIPQSALPYFSMEDENFKKCWSLENLRPLEALTNIKKGKKLI